MQSSFTSKQLDRRAATIIRGIRTRQVTPDSDAMVELAELTEAIADQPVKVTVVARLTVVRQNGQRTIVEVHSDARFSSFYHFFQQEGNRRSTKKPFRTASRNEGLNPVGYWQPGLETIAARLEKYSDPKNPIVKQTLRIIQRRAYKRLLSARPDVLGLTKTSVRMPWVSLCPSGSLNAAR